MRPAALLVAGALALGGCGGTEPPAPAAEERPALSGLSQASTATCAQWARAGAPERSAILADLEQAFGRRGEDGARGEVVPRSRAVDVLDRACGEPFARKFRLWKLYERAVAFG